MLNETPRTEYGFVAHDNLPRDEEIWFTSALHTDVVRCEGFTGIQLQFESVVIRRIQIQIR